MSRRENDFYETPAKFVELLLPYLPKIGTIIEPCSGDGSIANYLKDQGYNVITNDVDPKRKTDHHFDASDNSLWDTLYASAPRPWFCVTNPPFNGAVSIAEKAVLHCEYTIMMLRISFMEPVENRKDFLMAHPPVKQYTCHRHSFTNDGHTDSVTTAWYFWGDFSTNKSFLFFPNLNPKRRRKK